MHSDLVDQTEVDMVGKWPAQQIIILGLHDDDVEGHVGATPSPITIQICPQAYPVAVWAGVEGRTIE